jgi:hypothetical protein
MELKGLTAVLVAAASFVPGASAAFVRATAVLPACGGKNLAGSFRVVRGSAGAGNIVYALRLRNSSHTACVVTGIPGLTLLDAERRKLATHVAPAHPGALAAVIVRLASGSSAGASARFSPDVPGPGETVTRACEPTAHWLRVSPEGGGALVVPVTPPTPVCEHGTMQVSVLTAA